MGLYDQQVLPRFYSASAAIPGRPCWRELEGGTCSIGMTVSTVRVFISPGDYLPVVFGKLYLSRTAA